jgi:hypothetical protein
MSSSYFSSFMSRRKGLRNISLPGVRRAPSPPSPASFVSPAVLDINEPYDIYDPIPPTAGEQRLAQDRFHRAGPSQGPSTSPQLQLEFRHEPLVSTVSELLMRQPSMPTDSYRKYSEETIKSGSVALNFDSASDPRSADGSGSSSGWNSTSASGSASTSDSTRSREAFGFPSTENVIVVSQDSNEASTFLIILFAEMVTPLLQDLVPTALEEGNEKVVGVYEQITSNSF